MNRDCPPPDETPTVHAIILAAGAARRFGSPKQAALLQGETLLQRAVSCATAVTGNAVSVVLGAHAALLAPLLRHTPATIIINRDWNEGIASSIRAGIARLPGSCDAALLMLADQAAVTAADLNRLLGAWRRTPHHIAAAFYSDLAAVPAVFPRAHFAALQTLRGDQGARAVLKAHAAELTRIPMPSAAADVDTPQDLAALSLDSTAPGARHSMIPPEQASNHDLNPAPDPS